MSFNDPKDVESVLEVPPSGTPAATPGLTPVSSGVPDVGAPGLGRAPAMNAKFLNAPVTPPIATGLTSATTSGVAVSPDKLNAATAQVPATPAIVSSTVPVAVGAPTLSAAAPVQPVAAAKVAGAQLVPPTPPPTQTASQLSQPANAPQVLSPISMLTPQS